MSSSYISPFEIIAKNLRGALSNLIVVITKHTNSTTLTNLDDDYEQPQSSTHKQKKKHITSSRRRSKFSIAFETLKAKLSVKHHNKIIDEINHVFDDVNQRFDDVNRRFMITKNLAKEN